MFYRPEHPAPAFFVIFVPNTNPMKRLISLLLLLGLSGPFAALPASADWSYGTARFYGDKPSHCLSHGGVLIYYNGSLRQTMLQGDIEVWECTGDVCVIFPKNYKGRQIRFAKSAGLQVQYL